jgi:uncharacterized protein
MIPLRQAANGITFAVKLHPRAKKNAITGEIGDALKIAVIAPPIEGRANEACIEFLAKVLKLPRSSITIVSGSTSRTKVIRVAGLSKDDLQKRLLIAAVKESS